VPPGWGWVFIPFRQCGKLKFIEILAMTISITSFLIFLSGLCVGSFLNVLIYRLPRSLPITGRSFCPNCKKKISWYNNVPLLSFFLLRGRCRFCHLPISLQYPLVEFLTGVLTVFLSFTLRDNILQLVYYLVISYLLIVIFVSDWRYQIIPDQIIYFGIGVSLLKLVIAKEQYGDFIFSGLGAAVFLFLIHLFTRGRGMGLGDVKFAFLMGLILGFPKIILALYLAFLTGAFLGAILILTGFKRFGERVPFGPFLGSATFISLVFGDKILRCLITKIF